MSLFRIYQCAIPPDEDLFFDFALLPDQPESAGGGVLLALVVALALPVAVVGDVIVVAVAVERVFKLFTFLANILEIQVLILQ